MMEQCETQGDPVDRLLSALRKRRRTEASNTGRSGTFVISRPRFKSGRRTIF